MISSDGNSTTARLSPSPWLGLARIGWITITTLTLTLFLAGIPGRYTQLIQTADQRSLAELGFSAGTYAIYVLALSSLLVLFHSLIAGLIFWRRKGDWMALLVAYALVANGAVIPLSLMSATADFALYQQILIGVVISIGLVSSISLLYLFPNGRFVPPWTRPLAAIWIVIVISAIFLPDSPLSITTWPLIMQILMLLIWSGTGVYAQLFRYFNVSSPLQRQQAKWALFGLSAAVLGPFAYFLPFVIVPSISGTIMPNLLYRRVGTAFFTVSFLVRISGLSLSTLTLLLFPMSFAIAVLRYRLWDIDILIRRTLIYVSLTASLLLIYFSSVVFFQVLLRSITGEPSPLAVVISTLAIAALFNPLRRRLQNQIDRQFYRRKYDAEKTLAEFSATLRNEVDLSSLSEDLLDVVRKTMQPEKAFLWLRPQEVKRET
jgi:hypothetical protein